MSTANHSGVMAVIPAMNAESSIANVLFQLWRAKVSACAVIVNGCTDETERVALDAADTLFDLEQHGGQPMWVLLACSQGPLGLDVARAVGAYTALRSDIPWERLVLVDGDWRGAFGPSLQVHLEEVEKLGYDVTWILDRGNSALRDSRPDLEIWKGLLKQKAVDLIGVDPSRNPIVIRRSVFQTISPYYLHHPGLWTAHCILARDRGGVKVDGAKLRLGGLPFDARYLGNPAKSSLHQEKIVETLVGDAVEARELLTGGHPSRRWHGKTWIGYHSDRDTERLRQFAAKTVKVSGRVIRLT